MTFAFSIEVGLFAAATKRGEVVAAGIFAITVESDKDRFQRGFNVDRRRTTGSVRRSVANAQRMNRIASSASLTIVIPTAVTSRGRAYAGITPAGASPVASNASRLCGHISGEEDAESQNSNSQDC